MTDRQLLVPPRRRSFAAKQRLSAASQRVGITRAATALRERHPTRFVRIVNYHAVPTANAPLFAEHLDYYLRHYRLLDPETLERFLAGAALPDARPGLVLTFDDADPSHFSVVNPMLRERGLTGWFFVPVGRLGQRDIDGGVDTMTVNELCDVARHHVVGSHTQTHRFLGPEVDAADIQHEVVGARTRLEDILSMPITSFAWTGGAEQHYSSRAGVVVRETYRYGFISNSHPIHPGADPHLLYRTNIEAYFSLDLVRFQLSGLIDLRFRGARRRVDAILSPNLATSTARALL